jgi:hypothetical protein
LFELFTVFGIHFCPTCFISIVTVPALFLL